MKDSAKNNIVLIGMPGCGKSTIGVILAKHLGYDFVDTDIEICKANGRTLPQIMEDDGVEGLLAAENRVGLSIHVSNTVIATGGSMVLSEPAMCHLAQDAVVVWIKADIQEICRRISIGFSKRGVAAGKGESIEDIYACRKPYYEKYADVAVESAESAERTAIEIMSLLEHERCNWQLPHRYTKGTLSIFRYRAEHLYNAGDEDLHLHASCWL